MAHFDKDNPKSGFWLVTWLDGQFLRSEIAVPRQVETFRNQVIGHSEELVRIEEFRGKVPQFVKEFSYETFGQSMPPNGQLFGCNSPARFAR